MTRVLIVLILALVLLSCPTRMFATTWTTADATALQQNFTTNAACGDTIALTAGTTYTGNFTLSRDCSASGLYITVTTTGAVPAAPACNDLGTNTAVMACWATWRASVTWAKVCTSNATPAIASINQAHYWKFVGIEICSSYTGSTAAGPNIVNFGEDGAGSVVTTTGAIPGNLVFDRVNVHGPSTGGVRRGLLLNAYVWSVLGSYVGDVHMVGNETQGIGCWQCTGPIVIDNTYIEGGTQSVLIGGADPNITNLIPTNGTVTNNYMSKPLTWRVEDASYAGIHWSEKNVFELKNADTWTITHNVLERAWYDAQVGYVVLFTSLNDGGVCTWCTVKNVTFANNVVRHGNGGVQMLGHSGYSPPCPMPCDSTTGDTILIRNNLFYDISDANWDNGSADAGRWLQLSGGIKNVTAEHNTVDEDGSAAVIFADFGTVYEQLVNPVFKNNLLRGNLYGVKGSSSGSGTQAFTDYVNNGIYTFSTNVLGTDDAHPAYPDATQFPSIAAFNASFVDRALSATDDAVDYRLVNGSAYRGAGSDGLDIGVSNWCALPSGPWNTTCNAPLRLRVVGANQYEGPEAPATITLNHPGTGVTAWALVDNGTRKSLTLTASGAAQTFTGTITAGVGSHTLQILPIYGPAGDGPASVPFSWVVLPPPPVKVAPTNVRLQ